MFGQTVAADMDGNRAYAAAEDTLFVAEEAVKIPDIKRRYSLWS